MKERPIIMQPESVRGLLADLKTQTRRVMPVLSHPGWTGYMMSNDKTYAIECGPDYPDDDSDHRLCPFGVPGDLLWVKETWTGTWHSPRLECHMHLAYAADGSELFVIAPEAYQLPKAASVACHWVTPLFMPRWASRITLEITDVRVQQVQDISANDAIAEGISKTDYWKPKEVDGKPFEEKWWDDYEFWQRYPQIAYRKLWDSINAKRGYGWNKNPWVWVLDFRRVQ